MTDTSFESRLRAHRESLSGDFIPAIEAHRFIEQMEADHPDELAAWLRTHAVQFCTDSLSTQLRQERKRTRAQDFAEAAEAGDVSVFATRYEVAQDHTRRPVADMVGADHFYVAERYMAASDLWTLVRVGAS